MATICNSLYNTDKDCAMETIEHLYNALKEANKTIDNCKQTIDELSGENTFLTNTITANNLGKITAERRDMQLNMFRMQTKSEKAVSDARESNYVVRNNRKYYIRYNLSNHKFFYRRKDIMLVIENTKENRALQQVAATMAIEDMYFDKDFLRKMLQVSKGEKSTEEIIEEIKREYAR